MEVILVNREELKALGLTDEQIEKVMAAHGKVVNSTKEKADKVDGLESQIKDYKTQLKDRDKQLEELKKVDADGLQKKIDELQEENKNSKKEFESKLKETQLTSALKLALTGKVHDADLVAGLIEKDKIELNEDGTVKGGLDDQIKTLKESKSFLFVPEKEDKSFKGFKPGGGTGGGDPNTDIGSDFAKMQNEKSQPPKDDNSPWG